MITKRGVEKPPRMYAVRAKNMLKIGHRGAMGYAPENTLASFTKALELGVDGIELDVRLCRSGELVVIHDERVERTTNGKGRVRDLSLLELKMLDAGQGERISSLEEVLDTLDSFVRVDIELKEAGTAAPTAEALRRRIQKRGGKAEDFLVTSFDHHELIRFHYLLPEIPFGPLLVAKPLTYARLAQEMEAQVILPYFEYLDSDFVRDAHERDLQVIAWTVNRPEDIRRMAEIGVDGMVSNFPDRLP